MTMLTELALEHCRPLRGSEHALDPAQASALLADLPGWQIAEPGLLP
jgi:4a-hydroxytetrahydrobiopterin dehydratase